MSNHDNRKILYKWKQLFELFKDPKFRRVEEEMLRMLNRSTKEGKEEDVLTSLSCHVESEVFDT